VNADAKKGIRMSSLTHIFGFFHLIFSIECRLARSVVVPIKQNQPQPILPKMGDNRIKLIHIHTTAVITPQYIECHIKPIEKY
jgi:hypothetical protein